MSAFVETKEIDVVLLCGGLGKRLRSAVKGRPKPMAEVNGRPFLDVLIDYVTDFGFKRFILCTGYRGDKIKRYYQKRAKGMLEILFSPEEEPLDTGGAVKNAEYLIRSSPFLVMNGDSFCRVDLKKFLDFHLSKNALLSIVLAKVKNAGDYGSVSVSESHRVIDFNEKSRRGKNNYINAGIYFFGKEVLSLMPTNKTFSLEKDFFPEVVDREFHGYITQETFIDIGTPERYKEAKRLLK